MPQLPNRGRFGGTGAITGLVLVLLLTLAVTAFKQPIIDWWKLRGYQPPATISRLAALDTMTPYARHLFYLNKPHLLSSVGTFRGDCPENEDAIVLGCYHPGEEGIYIYDVKSADLQGVTQVTAAHEDLHAIYERLSDSERQQVDTLLENYYKHGLHNQRVKDEIAQYKKSEPNSVLDEMHSTFGTEVADLPAALEDHYRQYFSDRAAVVAFSQRYEQAFTDRQAKISQDDRQLVAMKRQIDSQETSLQAQRQSLDADQKRLQALLAAGQTDQYNAGVAAHNQQVRTYNAGVVSLKDLINRYNQLVAERNAVAKELTTLDKALDTRLKQDQQTSN